MKNTFRNRRSSLCLSSAFVWSMNFRIWFETLMLWFTFAAWWRGGFSKVLSGCLVRPRDFKSLTVLWKCIPLWQKKICLIYTKAYGVLKIWILIAIRVIRRALCGDKDLWERDFFSIMQNKYSDAFHYLYALVGKKKISKNEVQWDHRTWIYVLSFSKAEDL